MQSVGGAIIFVSWIALMSLSAWSLLIVSGFTLVRIEAFWHISFAVPGPTLENSVTKNCWSVLVSVLFSIFIRMPSSTPWGCGFISLGSAGISSVALGNIICSAFGFV